ncbi:hypothetical protein LCGC14_3078680, partial [marine sediment metagenome]
ALDPHDMRWMVVLAEAGFYVGVSRHDDQFQAIVCAPLSDAILVNSDTPELVLAEELAQTPHGWNGEPVLWDHPTIGGQRVSANDPRILETWMFGRIFNARFDNKSLKVEAWLDTARAAEMGGAAQDVIDRINDGELIEVSVGAFVVAEAKVGIHNGQRFTAIWREIVPDHLAMLPVGTKGACSNEMGCGGPRMAMSYRMQGGSIRAAADGLNDNDVRDLLREALTELEIAVKWLWIEAVFADTVIYSARNDETADEDLFERDYTLNGDAVTVGNERREVERIVSYEVAPGQSPATASRAGLLHALSADGLLCAPTAAADEADTHDSDKGPEVNEPGILTKLLERVSWLC